MFEYDEPDYMIYQRRSYPPSCVEWWSMPSLASMGVEGEVSLDVILQESFEYCLCKDPPYGSRTENQRKPLS
ncbi:hypothetical protein BYT27DRAFT_7184906 [Phlegmacium glaucopus]|nr:hypothetical protein BYT27DRAFT_7184906 [Phlegmacium glaucopus]